MQPFHIAVPTAFHADLSLDCETTIAHMRHLYQQGVRAMLVCGSTGEQHSLSLDERLRLLDTLAQANLPADLTLLFGVAHPFERDAMRLAEAVEQNRVVSALLLAAPPYIRPTQAEFLAYVRHLLSQTSKPVVLYNNPARTGFDMALSTLLELSQIPQIIGVKDPSDVVALKANLARDWLIFAGGEENLAEKIQAGFNGLSSIAGNVMPNEIQTWFTALLQNSAAKLPPASGQYLAEIYQDVPLLAIKRDIAKNEGISMQYHRRPKL